MFLNVGNVFAVIQTDEWAERTGGRADGRTDEWTGGRAGERTCGHVI